jgi:hypothetical protein
VIQTKNAENSMNEEAELSRADLLELIDAIGGHGGLDEITDDMLPAVFRNRLQLTDPARIEKALARPLPVEYRAMLMHRKLDLETETARRAMAVDRQTQRGGLTVRVPDHLGISHFVGQNGRTIMVRADESGHAVLDLFPAEFHVLLQDRVHGLDWQKVNEAAIHRLAEI